MGDTTGISWTDHTFNPWWGCAKIAPGCDNCYAAAMDKRTGGDYWNPRTPPRLTSEQNWNKPLRWNRLHGMAQDRGRVFCGSMMDWCDTDAPHGARGRLFDIIERCDWLDFQLLTKRATLIERSLPEEWTVARFPNVWLGVTVENRAYGYPRIDALRAIPAAVRFLSVEPMLERMPDIDLTGIHWVICGGESGPGCRPFDPAWAIELADLCAAAGVAFWFKQHGGIAADKGGCLLGGRERKHWPVAA